MLTEQLRHLYLFAVSLFVLTPGLPAQTISRFDFNSTATLMQATIGPNGTSINAVTAAPAGIAYVTSGCGAGVGMDLSVPGGVYNVNNITVRARFRRGSGEGTGNFFARDQFTFGFVGSRLFASWMVLNGATPEMRTLTTTRVVSTTEYREYEFWYDNCTGEAAILDNGTSVAAADFTDNCPLLWFSGDALIGSELDNACNQTPGYDWVQIAGNTGGCIIRLPIELGSFSGKMTETGAELQWTTLTETNNDFFSLERSPDGNDFAEFAEIAGAGTSTTPQQYRFTDPAPFAGRTYYRLRQTDFDGTFSYSEVISVATQPVKPALVMGPNPSSGSLKLRFTGDGGAEAIQVAVRDLHGALVHQETPLVSPGQDHNLDLERFPDGMYLVRVTQGNTTWTEKLLLQR
ncbi:MAG: T9SS type A sorting domain-containing protein [Bacteroidota bacterium]